MIPWFVLPGRTKEGPTAGDHLCGPSSRQLWKRCHSTIWCPAEQLHSTPWALWRAWRSEVCRAVVSLLSAWMQLCFPAYAGADSRALCSPLRRPKTPFPDAGLPLYRRLGGLAWIKSCGEETQVLPSSAAAYQVRQFTNNFARKFFVPATFCCWFVAMQGR